MAGGAAGSSPVRLRRLGPGDRDTFARWLENPDLRRHFCGRDEETEALPGSACASRPAGQMVRAIESDAGELLGWIELRDVNWRRRSGELRICLGVPATWGQGYGSAALRLFLGQAFGEWHLDSIDLRVATWNVRAIRAYERCGFRRTGRLRAGGRERDGLEDLWLMTARPGAVPGSLRVAR